MELSVMFWITAGLTAAAAIIALPIAVIAAQGAVALLPIGRSRQHVAEISEANRSFAVLIPAHNEALGIRDTIESVSGQLAASGRILVVADNCSDATAQIARDSGAEVLERTNATERGKGFALQAGLFSL